MKTVPINIKLSIIKGNIIVHNFIFFFFILSFIFISSFAQVSPYYLQLNADSSTRVRLSDTPTKKRFIRAATTLMIVEAAPWFLDNNIRHVDYTRISWQTLQQNIQPSCWTWDNDGFTTNQFGHPYHGSLFFNSFRDNGYNFWQSSMATFAGSYLWETVAESQPPAPNDFINTGFGGSILGEMTHRFANKIINNRSVGFKRQLSELAGLLIDPINGFNRLIDGKWGKRSANNAERDYAEVYTEFDLGARRFTIDKKYIGWYGHLKCIYGTPYENYKKPFSNIFIDAEFGNDDSSKVNTISVYGSLEGWKLKTTPKKQHVLLLTANYDFINNQAFFYSAQSVRLNLYSETKLTPKIKINTKGGTGLILLAAVPDGIIHMDRYYNYCWGLGFDIGASIQFNNHFFYSIEYKGALLKTFEGYASHYLLHTVNSEIGYKFLNKFSVCIEPGHYDLKTYYDRYPDTRKTYPYLKISARYNVTIK